MSDDGSGVEPDWMQVCNPDVPRKLREDIHKANVGKMLESYCRKMETSGNLGSKNIGAHKAKENVTNYVASKIDEIILEIYFDVESVSKKGFNNMYYTFKELPEHSKYSIVKEVISKLERLNYDVSTETRPDTILISWGEKENNASN